MPKFPQPRKYHVKKCEKYVGDPSNVIIRSSWELRFCLWLEANPAVLRWSSESVVIPYVKPTDNKVHRYFVDFWVEIKDRNNKITRYLVEIKPHCQSVPPKYSKRKKQATLFHEQMTYATNMCKWTACEQYAKKRGWKFVVITEKELGL